MDYEQSEFSRNVNRKGWLTAVGTGLLVGVYLQLGACGSSTSGNTNAGTGGGSTAASTTCDVSTQPTCPSTIPSYSGAVSNIFATYCLQCHDPNGVGTAVTTGSGSGMGGRGPSGDANGPGNSNMTRNPNFNYDPNFTNDDPNRWDPTAGRDWSKYANIHQYATDIEQQVFLCKMPPDGAVPLSAADKQTLLDWLACGAPNN